MRELKKKLNAKKIPEMKPKLTETQERTVTTDNSVREMEEGAGDWKGAQAPPPVYTVKLCLHLLYVLSNVLCLVAQLFLAL